MDSGAATSLQANGRQWRLLVSRARWLAHYDSLRRELFELDATLTMR
jgi:hypothetical protein